MPRRHVLLGSLLVAAGACEPPVQGTALFEVPRSGVAVSEFYALPFPNDIRRDDAGHPMLADYPPTVGLVRQYLDACETLDGFGANNAIFTRYSVSLAGARLPADAAASVADDASVYLVDVDPDSPERGQRRPIKLRFQTYAGWTIGDNWLAALPYPGFPLREQTTYALVITRRINSGDVEIAPAADFTAIVGRTEPLDPELVRARGRYQPLLAWLDEPGGDERDDVVSAAVFTTQSITGLMTGLRARVRELSPPVARDVTPIATGDPYLWYDGVFDAPNFQTGEVPYLTSDDGGDIVLADDGLPAVQRMEPIRFSMTIPPTPPPATGWPVVIYAHGTGGSFHSFVGDGTATRLAAQGLATISIDQVLHGPRNEGGDPEIHFFNFQNPLAARNNAIQGATDDFSVVRLVEGFERIEPPDPKTGFPGRTIRFDPDRIYFFGHSQGGLTGPPFVAFEPQVKGAVLSGAGGLLIYALLNKTEPFDITSFVRTVIIDTPLDEFNPVLSMLQMWIDRSDAVNYGPLLVREPPPGLTARPIYQSMGFIDHYTPLPTIEALAVAIGGDQVTPTIEPIAGLALRGRGQVAAPVTGNVAGVTSVVVQYEATVDDGHFVVFDVPAAQVQSARFLGTLAEAGTATLVAP